MLLNVVSHAHILTHEADNVRYPVFFFCCSVASPFSTILIASFFEFHAILICPPPFPSAVFIADSWASCFVIIVLSVICTGRYYYSLIASFTCHGIGCTYYRLLKPYCTGPVLPVHKVVFPNSSHVFYSKYRDLQIASLV